MSLFLTGTTEGNFIPVLIAALRETVLKAIKNIQSNFLSGVAAFYYPHEQHGFRIADNIKKSLEAELYFYSQILRFTPADPLEPFPTPNLK
ncbi:hypothetical protein [Paenibacillus ihumii]|uniref:hypothetical protein n=1 Tax=Paenibacillus ihumii TaxID=687436 RepID=UPI0006D7C76C|nr:hypothetical protein [Paenibacillus ihumii]